jgi:hypothetical protein
MEYVESIRLFFITMKVKIYKIPWMGIFKSLINLTSLVVIWFAI